MLCAIHALAGTIVTFTSSDFNGQGTSGTGSAVSATKDGVTFTCNLAYGDQYGVRCYKGSTITISSKKEITNIDFAFNTFNDRYYNGGISESVSVNGNQWQSGALASQARMSTISVSLKDDESSETTNDQDASEIVISEDCSQNGINAIIGKQNSINGHEYVDLGLPSGNLWATCNMEAETYEEYGGLFAWGEVNSREASSFSQSSYLYANDPIPLNDISGTQYDAASVNWGEGWKIPTYDDIMELMNNTSYSTITINDKSFHEFTASNGNKIYELVPTSIGGGFWSSTSAGSSTAYRGWEFGSNGYISYGYKWQYYPIRPIHGAIVTSENLTLTLYAENCETPNVYTCNANQEVTITAVPKSGSQFKQWNDGNTDNPRVVTMSGDLELTAQFESITSQISIVDTAFISSDCRQNGINAIIAQTINVNGHEFVDLGLPSGLLWATCNIGASTPEQIGDYYAWGELKTKSDYSLSTYQYYQSGYINLGNEISGTQYDVAKAKFGGDWRMPTSVEAQELLDKCNRIEHDNGLEYVGPNGKSIFIPKSGYRQNEGSYQGVISSFAALIWTGTYLTNEANGAWAFYGDIVNGMHRRFGLPVRPVCSKGATGQSTASTLPDYTLTLNATGCETSNTFACADGQEVTIKAIPQEHYHFVQWNDGDKNAIRTIVVTSDTTFTAEFAINQYTVEVLSENNEAGLVTGSGTFEALAEVTIMAAVCKDGYQWDRWSDGIALAGRKITLTSDTTLTAYFMTIPEEHCIEVGVNDETLGQADILIQAVPNEGATFVMWSDGDTTNPRVVTNSEITSYTAIFATISTDTQELPNANVSAHKLIREGHVYVLRGDKTYTLQGQEVK